MHIRHFKRKDGRRRRIVDGHIFCHRKHESSFTHGGTGGNDDKVRILPSRGEFVQVVESCFQSRETRGTVGGILHLLNSLCDDRVDLSDILFDIALRDFEKMAFGLLKEVVDIVALVVGLVFDS